MSRFVGCGESLGPHTVLLLHSAGCMDIELWHIINVIHSHLGVGCT